MTSIYLHSREPSETRQIAGAVAKLVRPSDQIVLAGELGSGKTLFTKAFGQELGISEPITSPTFNLVHSYVGGRLPLHHADLYRLDRTGELAELGLDELAEQGGVVIVEWGDVAGEALGDALIVSINYSAAASAEERTFEVKSRGGQWTTRWSKLNAALEPWAKK